jgi:hypothetical protein
MSGDAIAAPSEVPFVTKRETLASLWEADHVGKTLVKAFATLDRLPRHEGPASPAVIGRARSPSGPTGWRRRSSRKASAGPASGPTIAR